MYRAASASRIIAVIPAQAGIQYAVGSSVQKWTVSGILDHPPSRVTTTQYDSGSCTLDQVTQRPGWSSLATSVKTLTGGSQAIVRFGFAAGSGRLRISSRIKGDWAAGAGATGIRTTTDVSARFDAADRNCLGWVLRDFERRPVGLGAAVDFPRRLGRGELPAAGEVMA